MNEFLSRTDQVTAPAAPTPVPPAAVRAVPPAAAADGAGHQSAGQDGEEAQLSSAAEYARAHRKISDLLAELRNSESSLGETDVAIGALLPQPIVLVPQPPASREQMEHAVAVAKALREDALLARQAQANVHGGIAEAVIA